MRRWNRAFLSASILLAACTVDEDVANGPPLQQAIGEPMGTFPSPEERLMLMAINRARSDPATVKGPMSTIFPARPPVSWNHDLSRASRFHAINMMSSGATLMHSSPCTLNTNVGSSGCTGVTSCACASPVPMMCRACANVPPVNSCGTDTFTRIDYFTNIATGEVAAAGYPDTFSTVSAWVDEPTGADGHRRNLLDIGLTSNTMGAGRAGGSSCYNTFDVSDSGFINGQTLPKMPTGSVKPSRGAAGNFTFYVTWADPALGNPSSLSVVIDGTCRTMTRELGAATLNSTWIYTGALAAGCHSYYFLGRDAANAQVTYPTVGALNVSVGGTTCSADYFTPAPAASCAMTGTDLTAAPADLVAVPDLTAPPPDLTAPPDMTRLPDLTSTTLPDLTTVATQDLTMVPSFPDLATASDLATSAADLSPGAADLSSTMLPDLASASDLTSAKDQAGIDQAGLDLSSTALPDLRAVTTLADLAGQPSPPDLVDVGEGDLATHGIGLPRLGCGCAVAGRSSPDVALSSPLSSLSMLAVGLLLLSRRRRGATRGR